MRVAKKLARKVREQHQLGKPCQLGDLTKALQASERPYTAALEHTIEKDWMRLASGELGKRGSTYLPGEISSRKAKATGSSRSGRFVRA